MAYEDLEKGGGMKNQGNNRYQPGSYSPTFCWAWLIPMFVMATVLLILVVIIAINLAIRVLTHVNNFVNIGGFLTGLFLGFILLLRHQFGWVERQHCPADACAKSKRKVYPCMFWLVPMALLLVGFTVGLVMLIRGENGNEHCSWCHYLSCVSTPGWKCYH